MKTLAAVVFLAAILHAAGFASSSSGGTPDPSPSPSLPRLSISAR
jgi:hypothetical protein